MKKIDCKYCSNLLIDYIDKTLDKESTQLTREHLASCKSCQQELEQVFLLVNDLKQIREEEPPAILREKFLEQIENEKASQPVKKIKVPAKRIWLYNPFSQMAAGFALLISGVLLGLFLSTPKDNSNEVAQLNEELYKVKGMLFMSGLGQSSASQRIQAVNYTQELNHPDNEIISALIKTMDSDDNVNVRMAAMHALSKFTEQQSVRQALVNSLKTQEDALLQITLINILVEIQEENAIGIMKELLQKEETIDAVKQMAEKGLTTFI